MKVLDLFCGMGGWSIGFHREGFDCIGIDLVDVGYPYKFIQQDIRDYHPNGEKFDVIVASPPCSDFSTLAMINKDKPWKPKPERGLALMKEAYRIIDEALPRHWVIENVAGAMKHFYPILGAPSYKVWPYYLWGRFPNFMRPQSNYLGKRTHSEYGRVENGSWLDQQDRSSPLRPWLRARIPLPLSIGLAKAVVSTYNSEAKA